jgi:predicted negative regulator of RcsB-dependent stress response
MKFNTNTIILFIGILLIICTIWYNTNNYNTKQSEEYHKIDSLLNVIQKRQLRDSIRNEKSDSLLGLISNNNKVISGFVNELNKINNQLDQKITNINNLNANDLIRLYSSQLPKQLP